MSKFKPQFSISSLLNRPKVLGKCLASATHANILEVIAAENIKLNISSIAGWISIAQGVLKYFVITL